MGKCRNCSGKDFSVVIDLGKKPIAHRILDSPDEEEELFSLVLHICKTCNLIQVIDPIDPDILYRDFNYNFTSWKPEAHQPEEVEWITTTAGKGPIFEIGCNDGTLLNALREAGVETLVGVEPNKVSSQMSKDKGFEVYNDMISEEICRDAVKKYGNFNTVVSRQVFEHIPDIDKFLTCANILLGDDGYLFIDIPDVQPHIDMGDITCIWEEHCNYFTEPVVSAIFKKYGFDVMRVERYLFSGTTMALLSKKGEKSSKYHIFPKLEKSAAEFAGKIKKYGKEFKEMAENLKDKDYKIVLYGVGCKACIFVNGHELQDHIDFAIDDQKERQGKFMPGSKLEVKPRSSLDNYDGKLLCILCVNPENDETAKEKLKESCNGVIEFISVLGPTDIWAELERAKKLGK